MNANKVNEGTKGEHAMKSFLNMAVAAAVLAALAASANATAYTAGSSGNWGDSAVWGGSGFPNAAGDTANLSVSGTWNLADSNGLDASFTVASVSSSTGSNNMTIQNVAGGTGALIFDNNGNNAYFTTTKNSGKKADINVRVILNDNLIVTSRVSGEQGANFRKEISSGSGLTTGLIIARQSGTSSAQAIVDVQISAAASYTGETRIMGSAVTGSAGSQNGGGKLRINLDNALPITTVLRIDGAEASWYAQGGALKLNGHNQEVAGVYGAAGFDAGEITTSSAATLTINNSADYDFEGNIGGAAGTAVALVKKGIGTQTLSGVNNYTGDTTVEDGTLTLASTGGLSFVIGASGVNNKITGDGAGQTVNLDGAFTFDLTGAGTTVGDSWTIVDYAGLAAVNVGATFAVTNAGWTETAGVWTGTDTNGATYAFSESTGVLAVIPEPATMCLLAVGGAACLFRRRK